MNVSLFSSLRVRLIMLVLMGAIPLLILLIFTGLELRNGATEEAQRDVRNVVMIAVNEQQRLVNETRQLLLVLSQAPQVQSSDIAGCNRFLANLLKETKSYINLGVIQLNGDVVCSGTPFQGAINVNDRAYFKRTLKNLDFSVGDYQIGRISGVAVLVFSFPVVNDNEGIKGLIYAALPLSWINNQLSEALLPPGSVVNVIDHSTHTLLADYPDSAINVGTSVEKTMLVEAMHTLGGTGMAEVTGLDGIVRLYAFDRLQNLPDEKEIYVTFGIPMVAAYAKVNATIARNFAILLAVVFLMLLFAWYGSNVLVLKQITGLLAMTRRVASGDLDARVAVSNSRNEISQLGCEFNQMTIALKQRDSEARQAENLLQKSEKELRRVLETVPDIIYTATVTNNFNATFVSPALTRILGFTPQEFIMGPDRWAASIHDEDREYVFAQLQSALDNAEENLSIEYRMWHKDRKTFRWFEDRVRINRDTSDHTTVLYGIMTDITDQKQAERISTRLGRILQDSWNEIYVFDANTLRFVDVSNGACQNLGYSLDELKQLTPIDLKPDFTSEQFEALLGSLRRGEKSQATFEVEYQRKDGSHYLAEIRLQLSSAETPPVFIAISQDISERKRYIEELEHKSLYDHLTDLPNRSLFQDRLKQAISLAHRDASSLVVLMIDVMRLREVNDILGHHAGDLVLQEVASRLQKMLRKSDTVAHLGGDEYAILFSKVDLQQASMAARKIQTLFEQPFMVEDISLEIEATIGIALYPEHGDEPAILLQHADIAMRVAKNEGVRFSIFHPEDNPYSLRRLKLLGELRQAIEQKELTLYYQPQVDIKLGCITGVEALARWPHKTEGMIPPNDFIPMIEQSGLIQPFTLWVLEEAILELKGWAERGIDLTMSVNLSTRNLLDSGLPDYIAKLLQVHKVSPAHLMLEVTESALMLRPEVALKALTQLNEMGLKLSIDDFGTGYSSLSYLKKLPVDELKVDQAFVFGLTANDDDAVIVHSTIELAHNMGLQVVAEGVEDQDTLDMLAILKCDIAQGYYLSRPVPAHELNLWLVNSSWGIPGLS